LTLFSSKRLAIHQLRLVGRSTCPPAVRARIAARDAAPVLRESDAFLVATESGKER